MYHYSLALSRSSFIMANSSWTKNHVDAILSHSDPVMNVMHFLNPLFALRLFATAFRRSKELHAKTTSKKWEAKIVYPPCDTREMAQFPLDKRERIILSIAQFRYVSIPLFIHYWSSSVTYKARKGSPRSTPRLCAAVGRSPILYFWLLFCETFPTGWRT